ncbi:MaoC/PaaZ C-terminal domain-containing protein [Nocardia iowensis]|uniref:MaoC-like domain-containing protein n=1 Tax=Nocardia iowensis TaxID=204891 RepID=A0ABX8RXA2_NOCIO|nr:MaoC/PaaZ C-terminal domain-containing protein [Nocardia iowensis]QXN92990.1 hypothetical protein KV110_07735 [Nocardia iowensis]
MIDIGTRIPPLRRRIEQADMIAYAGATWDWHRLHYDTGYVTERGLPAPVIDGQLFGALLAEQLLDWIGPRARITRLHFRFRAMAFAGETVCCTGEVIETDPDGALVVRQQVAVAGDRPRVIVAPAGATVLPE